MKFRISPRANADLDSLWNYIAQDAPVAADRVEAELHAAMRMLAANPGLGHSRPDVRQAGYRFWMVFKYVIAYRVRGRIVTVVRVLHGHCDFRKLFRRRRNA